MSGSNEHIRYALKFSDLPWLNIPSFDSSSEGNLNKGKSTTYNKDEYIKGTYEPFVTSFWNLISSSTFSNHNFTTHYLQGNPGNVYTGTFSSEPGKGIANLQGGFSLSISDDEVILDTDYRYSQSDCYTYMGLKLTSDLDVVIPFNDGEIVFCNLHQFVNDCLKDMGLSGISLFGLQTIITYMKEYGLSSLGDSEIISYRIFDALLSGEKDATISYSPSVIISYVHDVVTRLNSVANSNSYSEEDDAVYSRSSWYGVILDLITALGQHYTVCVGALSMINSWLQLMREKEGDKKIDSILRSSFDFSISDDFVGFRGMDLDLSMSDLYLFRGIPNMHATAVGEIRNMSGMSMLALSVPKELRFDMDKDSLSSMNLLDTLQMVDDDNLLDISNYDMEDDFERLRYIDSALEIYKREFIPKYSYSDVTYSSTPGKDITLSRLSDYLESGTLTTPREIDIEGIRLTPDMDTDYLYQVNSTDVQLNLQNDLHAFLKALKLLKNLEIKKLSNSTVKP